MITVVKKHPLISRWNHWINFPVLAVMIWSGLLIYWAHPAYFVPQSWLNLVGWDYQLAKGMGWHFAFSTLFTFNGIIYLCYLFGSGNWRYIAPDKSSLKEAILVLLHDLKISPQPLPPVVKYNGAQRLIYSAVIILGALATLSGFAIYKPIQLGWLLTIFGGYERARFIHFLITWCFVAFFVVHLIQVTRAGWNSLRAMIIGWEKKND